MLSKKELRQRQLKSLARAYKRILSGECPYLKPQDLTKKYINEMKKFINKYLNEKD